MRMASDFFWGVATVYGEARGEPDAGKIAVGEVIRTRAKSKALSVAAVVLEPLMFSCWNSHDPNRLPMAVMDDTDPVVTSCASAWLASEGTNLTNGADHYFAVGEENPSWYTGGGVQIGSQIFCKAP